jgi:hypothetical protein
MQSSILEIVLKLAMKFLLELSYLHARNLPNYIRVVYCHKEYWITGKCAWDDECKCPEWVF